MRRVPLISDGSACLPVCFRSESARQPGLCLDDDRVARPGKGIGPRRREGDAALITPAFFRYPDNHRSPRLVVLFTMQKQNHRWTQCNPAATKKNPTADTNRTRTHIYKKMNK